MRLKKKANMEKLKEYIQEMIKNHEDTYDENHIRDFIDLYVQMKLSGKQDEREVFTSKCTCTSEMKIVAVYGLSIAFFLLLCGRIRRDLALKSSLLPKDVTFIFSKGCNLYILFVIIIIAACVVSCGSSDPL